MFDEQGMKTALGASTALHVIVIVLTIVGLPFLAPDPLPVEPQVMVVELAPVAEKTNPRPEPEKVEAPKPEPAPPPKAEAPKPEPKPEPPQPKAEAPKPEPKPEPAPPEPPKAQPAPPPEPAPPPPKPEPVVVPEPAPAPPPEKKVEAPPPPPKPAPRPPKKAEPPKPAFDANALAALLNKRAQQSAPPTPQPDTQANPQAPPVVASSRGSSEPLTISEIDLIRRQIERCWNPPIGAKDAGELIIRVRVQLNPDGSLRRPPDMLDRPRADPFWQAAADSVRRAILRCTPIKDLPPGKYERWRDIEFTFNPKDMVG